MATETVRPSTDDLKLRTAAERLKQLEAEAASRPLDEILKYLDGCSVSVSLDLVEGLGALNAEVHHVGHANAEYTIAYRRWSEEGVRSIWAEQKLIWSLRLPADEDQEAPAGDAAG